MLKHKKILADIGGIEEIDYMNGTKLLPLSEGIASTQRAINKQLEAEHLRLESSGGLVSLTQEEKRLISNYTKQILRNRLACLEAANKPKIKLKTLEIFYHEMAQAPQNRAGTARQAATDICAKMAMLRSHFDQIDHNQVRLSHFEGVLSDTIDSLFQRVSEREPENFGNVIERIRLRSCDNP